MVFLTGFPPFSLTVETRKRLREFEERETSRQTCRGDCEYQGGKLLILLSGFRSRIRPHETDQRATHQLEIFLKLLYSK